MITSKIQFPDWSLHVEEALKLPRITREQASRSFTGSIVFCGDDGLVEVVYDSRLNAYLVSDPSDAVMAPLPPIP